MNGKFLAISFLLLFFACYAAAGDLYMNTVSYEPAPVSSGSTMSIWTYVTNNSLYEAVDARIKADVEYPFSLQPGQTETRYIGAIESYKTVSVEFKVIVDPKASDGKYSMKFHFGEKGLYKSKEVLITVQSRTPKLEIVESDITEVSPGRATAVNLTIKNVGGSVAKNIVVKTTEDRTVTSTGVVVEREIVSLGGGANYIQFLDPDEEARVQLLLGVNQDAELKNYSVPITLEYYDVNGTAKTNTGYLGLKVTAEPDLDAVIGSVKPFAFPGMPAELTVDLFNLGLADARYIVVELEAQGIEIEEPKQFIGTLEADDFDSFKTGIKVGSNVKAGQVPITLKITYKDDKLEPRVVTKQLSMKVLNAGELQAATGGGPALIVVGLISLLLQLIGLFIVARFIYKKYRKFREK